MSRDARRAHSLLRRCIQWLSGRRLYGEPSCRKAASLYGISASSYWRYVNGQLGPRSKIPARIAAARAAAARDDEGGECA
ncbi:MAG: hypothetical protein C4551_02375 [Bacillota bacterium]|nr:MAG: hypothetical protein C4551_02375 [Bacillota bacterium]